ncbi:MAG: AmmeMemoRadiSam system protein B [Magnetococcales bacterium]|nr:AmmeMemoRadiSam system protein B [Magnetococcales bacterium]
MNAERVRTPAVAGMFYPGDAGELRAMVRDLLNRAPAPPADPVALVAPHAGFVYSGLTAAHAYKALQPAPAGKPRRVFLLGPSHRVRLDGVSVGNYSACLTPLGRIEVDREAVQCLTRHPRVSEDGVSHRMEHSLETQLPFLQETLVHFRIVPMVYGETTGRELADLLESCMQPEDLIVISTDLSHYHPYALARERDAQSHAAVMALDPEAMDRCEACGNLGVQALLETAKRRHWRPVLADLRNSGDTAGDRKRVVGYASYLFFPEAAPATRETPATPGDLGLALPGVAREHLIRTLRNEPGVSGEVLTRRWPELAQPGATFVTLKKQGQLRGCIGTLSPHRPLAEDLLENTLSAALRDPRFPPLAREELPLIDIEVSLLTPPEPLPHRDAEDLLARLRPGVHGVILAKNGRRATFLPQVWEQLPDPLEFLGHLCRKAGLDGSCWRQGAEIQVYTVQKFQERTRPT